MADRNVFRDGSDAVSRKVDADAVASLMADLKIPADIVLQFREHILSGQGTMVWERVDGSERYELRVEPREGKGDE